MAQRSIHNTVKAHYGDSLYFTVKGGTERVPVDDLPESTLVELIRYGASRKVNDKLGGMDAAEAGVKATEYIEELKAGVTPGAKGGGGGRSLSPFERALRDLFVSTLTGTFGWKKAEADKASKSTEDRQAALLQAVANKKGLDPESQEAKEKMEIAYSNLEGKAAQIKEKYETDEADLGI